MHELEAGVENAEGRDNNIAPALMDVTCEEW